MCNYITLAYETGDAKYLDQVRRVMGLNYITPVTAGAFHGYLTALSNLVGLGGYFLYKSDCP